MNKVGMARRAGNAGKLSNGARPLDRAARPERGIGTRLVQGSGTSLVQGGAWPGRISPLSLSGGAHLAWVESRA